MRVSVLQLAMVVVCTVQVSPLRACSIEHALLGWCCHDDDNSQSHLPCLPHDGACVCKLDHQSVRASNPTSSAPHLPTTTVIAPRLREMPHLIAPAQDAGPPPPIQYTPLLN